MPQSEWSRFLCKFRQDGSCQPPPEPQGATDVVAKTNMHILYALDKTIPMNFSDETPLEDVLKYIVAETRSNDGSEVPIYVDPAGLQEAAKTLQSTVTV